MTVSVLLTQPCNKCGSPIKLVNSFFRTYQTTWINLSWKKSPEDTSIRTKVVEVYGGHICHLVIIINRLLERFRCMWFSLIDTPETDSPIPQEN